MDGGSEMDAARAIFNGAIARCGVRDALDRVMADVREVLGAARRVAVIAMGKGAAGMLQALLQRDEMAGREVVGVLVAPPVFEEVSLPGGIRYFTGEHPVPGESSFAAARAIFEIVDSEAAGTPCFFLISGGASAMVELPLGKGIGLEDVRVLYQELVLSGAAIAEINCVRKHFSAIKGGRLGVRARHLRQLTLLVSDVPEGQTDALASGPTVADGSTVTDCLGVLDRYELWGRLPAAVVAFFRGDELVETPKVGGPAVVMLSSGDLAGHAAAAAREMGYEVVIDEAYDEREYRVVGEYLLGRMRGLRAPGRRICLVSVGECLVRVEGDGVGGRNQQLALYVATRMTVADAGMAMLSCGSDGVDGNSTATGAVVSWERCGAATGFAERALAALDEFRAHGLLREMGCVVQTGATGINLRDLRVLVARD